MEFIALFMRDKRVKKEEVWKMLENAKQQPRPHCVGMKVMTSSEKEVREDQGANSTLCNVE